VVDKKFEFPYVLDRGQTREPQVAPTTLSIKAMSSKLGTRRAPLLKPIDEATTPAAVSSRPRRRAATRALDVIDNDLARRQKLSESERAEEDEDSQDYGFSESLDDDEATSSEDIDDDEDEDEDEEEEEEEKPPKRRRKAAPKRPDDEDEEGSGE
jgi:hypothetical protein